MNNPLVLAPSITVLGTELSPCSNKPLTGFLRDGLCNTCSEDAGSHTVCVEISDAFLLFSKMRGNDLMTPHPEFGFAGLKPGDSWCLCAGRWLEAFEAGIAPKVILASTHQEALKIVPLEHLLAHAVTIN
jgi:uncharacterized protein (DUF2237 family)